MTPLVSIVTPAFNAQLTLRRAHNSVRSQTLRNWEHIIVDDGSTDGTAELIGEISMDVQVTTVTMANSGPGAALNVGVRASRGRYIAFLDADDEYLPHHVYSHVDLMNTRADVHVLWGGIQAIAGHPDDLLIPNVETGNGRIHVLECIVQGTIFARREVFETCRFTEDRQVWWQDYDFVKRAEQQYRVERFEGETYRYYRTSASSIVGRVKAQSA